MASLSSISRVSVETHVEKDYLATDPQSAVDSDLRILFDVCWFSGNPLGLVNSSCFAFVTALALENPVLSSTNYVGKGLP